MRFEFVIAKEEAIVMCRAMDWQPLESNLNVTEDKGKQLPGYTGIFFIYELHQICEMHIQDWRSNKLMCVKVLKKVSVSQHWGG